jgi:hypothetical protein
MTNDERCFYCSTDVSVFNKSVDHLFPKSRGGIRSNNNKVISCMKCNQLKGSMDVNEFYESLELMIRFEHNVHNRNIAEIKKIRSNIRKYLNA